MLGCVEGCSVKILNDCLRTKVKFGILGILEMQSFLGVPPGLNITLPAMG